MKSNLVARQDREALFTRLYLETYPLIASWLSKHGSTLEQSRDIFQESLIIYYEQVLVKEVSVTTSEQSYLLGIARHLWYQQLRQSGTHLALNELGAEPAEVSDNQVSDHRLLNFLERAGQRCMEILRAFYYDQTPLTEIAKGFGFSGTRSATVQKYKCLERVREEVKTKKLSYADFTE